jgi:ABC-type Fe3+ transport system permease subunit
MIATQQLKIGLVIVLLALALIVMAVIYALHMGALHQLAPTAVEYARIVGHSPAAIAIEYYEGGSQSAISHCFVMSGVPYV